MRIDCPSCAARYDVPSNLLAGRKTLRCARCGTEWTPPASEEPAVTPSAESAEAPDSAAAADAAAADTVPPSPAPVLRRPAEAVPPASAMARLAASPARGPAPRRARGVALAWVLSLAVVGLLVIGAIVLRDEVMRAWPPSTRLYAALGLTTPAR